MDSATPTSPRVERALISTSDKTGLVEFAQRLVARGIVLYSTGGTRRHLEAAGVPVVDVAAYTGFPEMLEGRVKTLHPRIHGGILCRRDRPGDMAALAAQGIVPLELVVVNLYPFAETVANADAAWDECIEQIDIGGPSLVRAAAKNHAFVTIATSPQQYDEIAREIEAHGCTSPALRRRLAAAAFAHTAAYDHTIAAWFARQLGEDAFPDVLHLSLRRLLPLRYGENPHQRAALYADPHIGPGTIVGARQLHGKELSYNNLLDLESALALVRLLPRPAVAVIKHNNPCGAAQADLLAAAAQAALDGDPTSAFGSVLAMNRTVDAATADVLAAPERFIEAVAAPDFDPKALHILTTRPRWRAKVRLLATGPLPPPAPRFEHRQLAGGLLRQDADTLPDDEAAWTVATRCTPTAEQWQDLRFAWCVVRQVKSNAVVVCREQTLVGTGAGQMSRIDATEIALRKAGPRAAGAVLASDAFFPFPDSIERAAAAGIAAIIQPGGSRNDEAVLAACQRHGLAMVLTARRHFKH